jgi:predicted small secreted protein
MFAFALLATWLAADVAFRFRDRPLLVIAKWVAITLVLAACCT